jgi:hypothetical protein
MNNNHIYEYFTENCIMNRHLTPLNPNDIINGLSIKLHFYQLDSEIAVLKQLNNIYNSKHLFKKPYLVEYISIKNSDFYYLDHRIFRRNKLTDIGEVYRILDYNYIKSLNTQFEYIEL